MTSTKEFSLLSTLKVAPEAGFAPAPYRVTGGWTTDYPTLELCPLLGHV